MYGETIADRIKRKYTLETDEPTRTETESGDFKRLIDYVGQNQNPDMWAWVAGQDNVVKAKTEMETLFNAYLFERMKPEFAKFCKDSSSTVISDYVDATINTSKEYVSPTVQLEEERKQLQDLVKQQAVIIEELKAKKEVIKI